MYRYLILITLSLHSCFACLCQSDITSSMKDATKIVVTDGINKSTEELVSLTTKLTKQILSNKLKKMKIDTEINLLKVQLLELKKLSHTIERINTK